MVVVEREGFVLLVGGGGNKLWNKKAGDELGNHGLATIACLGWYLGTYVPTYLVGRCLVGKQAR